MAILPDLPRHSINFTDKETIWIAFTVYVVFALFLLMLAFCLYNIYWYLYKQKKWRVFPISMFYGISLVLILVRAYLTIFTVHTVHIFGVFGTLMPAVLKVAIGIVQIEVIIELIIRVK